MVGHLGPTSYAQVWPVEENCHDSRAPATRVSDQNPSADESSEVPVPKRHLARPELLDPERTEEGAEPTVEIPVYSRSSRRRRAWWRIGITVVILAIVFALVLPTLADVDYAAVWSAITSLSFGQVAVITLVWVLRIAAEALIYTSVMPGLSVLRGMIAYLSSQAVSSTVPGPVDLVVRFAMYREWGIEASRAGVSVAASGIFSVGSKLVLPVIALVMLAIAGQASEILVQAAIVGAVLVALAGALLVFVVRSERFAHALGRGLERIADWITRLFNRRGPEIVDRIVVLRRDAIELLSARWWMALLATVAAIVMRFVLLLLIVRFMGVPDDVLSWLQVFTAMALVQFASTVPITSGNVGVAEVAYLAVLGAFAGTEWIDEITAAIVLFRALTWFVNIPIGWATYGTWQFVRSRARRRDRAAASAL